MKNKFKKWECALLLSLCFTLCYSAYAMNSQKELAAGVVRLHIIAQSNSESDQRLKLEVRDRLLERLEPELSALSDIGAAMAAIESRLPELESLAADISGQSARAELGSERYPTRDYDSFSLPAGEYLSLRVTLGEGEGENWWCVVFPPLCMSVCEETSVAADALTDEQVKLITGDGAEYQLRFKALEYIEKIRALFS